MSRIDFDIDYLRTRLRYEPETGNLIWLKAFRHSQLVGTVAGCIDQDGYVTVKIDNRQCKAHRICWALHHGSWPADQVDHINGIRSDNRADNLRLADQFQNNQNQSVRGSGVTGLRGVTFVRKEGRYRASIKNRGVTTYLGAFDTPEEAHAVYMKAKAELHEFAPNLRKDHGIKY